MFFQLFFGGQRCCPNKSLTSLVLNHQAGREGCDIAIRLRKGRTGWRVVQGWLGTGLPLTNCWVDEECLASHNKRMNGQGFGNVDRIFHDLSCSSLAVHSKVYMVNSLNSNHLLTLIPHMGVQLVGKPVAFHPHMAQLWRPSPPPPPHSNSSQGHQWPKPIPRAPIALLRSAPLVLNLSTWPPVA